MGYLTCSIKLVLRGVGALGRLRGALLVGELRGAGVVVVGALRGAGVLGAFGSSIGLAFFVSGDLRSSISPLGV